MSPGPAEAPATTRTAVLFTHGNPPDTDAAVRTAVEMAERASVSLVLAPGEHDKHPESAAAIRSPETLPDHPEICLVLGGDGTILRALRAYAGSGVPIFGINFGTIGFLAATEGDELAAGLQRAFSGEYEVMEMPALEVPTGEGPEVGLNDVSFTRPPHGRVAELSYSLGGHEVGNVRCDGLVAATPAGSTGYNLANQGPILAWGVKGYVVSFIAPHTLTARPLVVAPSDVLLVTNEAPRDPVDVAIDGRPVGELPSGDALEVRFREAVGRLAQLPGSNFYRRIREKFGRLAH